MTTQHSKSNVPLSVNALELTRREFLGGGAKLAAGLSIAPGVMLYGVAEARPAEQAASSEIITIEREGQASAVGVITVPSFYQDYDARSKGEQDYVSTTRDVKRLIGELQQDGIVGLSRPIRT